jgi:hypothetical protein
MNITIIIIGTIVALVVIYLFKRMPSNRRVLAYSLLLATFPVYYWVFAFYALDYCALFLEIIAGLIFFPIAYLYLRFQNLLFLYLLAAGYLLHSAYDGFHHFLFINSGTPYWWPAFCGSVDFILGAYLIFYATWRSEVITNR